jgi:Ca2+-binding RTX toxin-like protein
MGIVSSLRDAFLEIKRIAEELSKDGTIDFTSDMRDGLDLAIEFVEGGGSAEDFSSEQLDKVRGVIDAIAIGAAASAIVFVVGATGAVAVATAGGVTLVGVVLNEAASALLGSVGLTLVPDHIDYSGFAEGTRILGTNSLISGDVIISTRHGDSVFADGGHDSITNTGGSDTIFGGLGQDTLDYSAMAFSSSNGIVLDASAGDGSFVVHHHADTDVVESVEAVIGTSVADAFLLGNYGANIAGGGHLESIDAGAGDDVALLLNEGGAGPRRVAIDGGAGIDVIQIASDSFNTEIDFTNGTVRYQGGVNAQFAIANFEAARGGDGSDVMLGSDDADYLLGNDGADHLFGGGGDDFIFFDAEDTQVNGGAGWDVAWAVTDDAITADLAAMALECMVGGGGNDAVTMSGSDDLMAAGGEGDDVFTIHTSGTSPSVIWGGSGADTCSFVTGESQDGAGILVVNAANLTAANFHLFDREMLGLGVDFNWSKIDAIVLNPDSADTFFVDGEEINVRETTFRGAQPVFNTSGEPIIDPVTGEYVLAPYEHGSLTYDTASVSASEIEGGSVVREYDVSFLSSAVQSVQAAAAWLDFWSIPQFSDGVGSEYYYTPDSYPSDFDPEQAHLKSNWETYFGSTSRDIGFFAYHVGADADMWKDGVYDEWGMPSLYQAYGQGARSLEGIGAIESAEDIGSWFVFGGAFDGKALSADGSFSITMPDAVDNIAQEWLLVA